MKWKAIETAPWGEWVLVYRPLAEAQRMFGMDIRRKDEFHGVWKHSRPDEMPTLWCIPNMSKAALGDET